MSETQENKNMVDSLKKRADFLHVQAEGQKWVSKSAIVQICPNEDLGQRFGLVVTKKLHKLAVDRNRVKRRLRAVLSEILPKHVSDNIDVVVIARSETISKPHEGLKKDLLWCLKRLNALKD